MSEKTENTSEGYEGWAILEIFGHRSHGCYIRPWRLAGHSVLRVDVPDVYGSEPGDGGAPTKVLRTHYYGGSAVFCLTPATEETARGHERRLQYAPPQHYQLPSSNGDGDKDEEGDAEPSSPEASIERAPGANIEPEDF